MKKTRLLILPVITSFFLAAVSQVQAQVETIKFDNLNPFYLDGSDDARTLGQKLITPGAILTRVLYFAFPAAGLILFAMIVWGGFEMLSGASNSKSKDAGRQRVTAAVIGFILLFSAYWIAQIMEAVFGVSILNSVAQ
jgi:hypothetical protein